MYTYLSKEIGCKDCTYYEAHCKKCLNKTKCVECIEGYVIH